MSHVLGIFAKEPRPGLVKTRLAAETSPEFAARVATALLTDLLDRLACLKVERHLVFTPPTAEPAFQGLSAKRYQLTPQADGDLGQRLAAFFLTSLARGAERVVVIGMDSPNLPLPLLEEAFAKLAVADVVLGPATDGGYYLVGCAGRVPPLFTGVRWSTSHVLADTIAQLADPAWKLALLPPWYDVDSLEDLQVLHGHLKALRRAGQPVDLPATEHLLEQWAASLAPLAPTRRPH